MVTALGSGLPEAHDVALRILEVGERTHIRDRRAWCHGAAALCLDLLQGITLRTYLNGVARDTASYGALLDLDLLGLSGDSGHTLVS